MTNFCQLIMSIQVPTEDNCELELYTLLIYFYYSLNYTDKLNTARAEIHSLGFCRETAGLTQRALLGQIRRGET